jgi:hypothetical protein
MSDSGIVIFFVAIVSGIIGMIWAGRMSVGPRKGLTRMISSMVLGGGFALSGLVGLVGIHTSDHTILTGHIVNLSQHHGKSSSSTFYVADDNGKPLKVRCDYAGNHLVNGEGVSVDELNYRSTLLSLTILDGKFAGWVLTERDGSLGAGFGIALGLFLAFSARRQWQRDPNGLSRR